MRRIFQSNTQGVLKKVGKIAKNVLKMSKNVRFLSKNCKKLSLFVPLFSTPRANNRAELQGSSKS